MTSSSPPSSASVTQSAITVKMTSSSPSSSASVTRSAIAYWLLGLSNNFGYTVMLSAAHDILARFQEDNAGTSHVVLNESRQCNHLSTGIILLADILPCLLVKIVLPFLPLWMGIRVTMAIITSGLGFILVGMSNSLPLALLGVASTSFSSGIGESSLLSYTVFYKHRAVVSAWSSGTGGAGFFGSLTYAGLIAVGIPPSTTLFLLLSVPLTMAISYWIILLPPSSYIDDVTEAVEGGSISRKETADAVNPTIPTEISQASFRSRLGDLSLALKYMVPLFLVYYFEYVINQGLFELSLIDHSFIDRSTQYRWYQVFYQIGVFISRSSIGYIQIKNLWLLAIFQGLNTLLFTTEAVYQYVHFVVIIFALILWEGLLGGASYVNTFYQIQVQTPPEKREVITGLTTASDTISVALAGLTAIQLHNMICQLPI